MNMKNEFFFFFFEIFKKTRIKFPKDRNGIIRHEIIRRMD